MTHGHLLQCSRKARRCCLGARTRRGVCQGQMPSSNGSGTGSSILAPARHQQRQQVHWQRRRILEGSAGCQSRAAGCGRPCHCLLPCSSIKRLLMACSQWGRGWLWGRGWCRRKNPRDATHAFRKWQSLARDVSQAAAWCSSGSAAVAHGELLRPWPLHHMLGVEVARCPQATSPHSCSVSASRA